MPITRRRAIQALAAAGATAALPRSLQAARARVAAPEAVAVLYDPVRCIGCKACIEGCAVSKGCDPESAVRDEAQLSPSVLTVLRSQEAGGTQTFMKMQCMHCVDPACVSACMLGAMAKNADGSVTWQGDLCVGCRYCGIGCPYNVPRFEWDTPLPKLTKCELCPERRAEGKQPACVESCVRGALVYGKREEMLAEARGRIAARPDQYEPHIYGEHEGGGTSMLYMAKKGVSFASMGLPSLGPVSVPFMPEKIQHTLYKGFAAPLALLAVFTTVVKRNKKRAADAAGAHHEEDAEPVGGKLLTWPVLVLAALASVAVGLVIYRFIVGLGATTALNDGYPKGLWLTFNVVVGTALACGGYGLAILVYLLNRGRYHPLVRSAMLVSALGYTGGGLTVLLDLGRTWNVYALVIYPGKWNFNSILLEVALCVMLYTCVLWVEVSPGLIAQWKRSGKDGLRRIAEFTSPKIEAALPYAIAVGLLLPTMHQSSLGSLMLLAGSKLHPLWQTNLLPALFLISCVAMGYAGATLECLITGKAFKRPMELGMLRRLARPFVFVIMFYVILRALDVVWRDQMMAIWRMDRFTYLFFVEMGLFLAAAVALLAWGRRAGPAFLATVAVMVAFGGALYRFSTFLIAFDPGPQWSYFPTASEIMVSIGLVAGQVLLYVLLVKLFPILRGAPRSHDTPAGGVADVVTASAAVQPQGTLQAAPALASAVETTESSAPRPAAQVPGAPGRSGPPRAALGTAMVLLALFGALTPLSGQTRAQNEDLRCLSPLNPAHCLPEPVPADEPHGAVCATCHNLKTQATFAEAGKTCASAGCHTNIEKLTPFHRGIRQATLQNCIGCHPAHDAKLRKGGNECTTCHVRGGDAPALRGSGAADLGRPVSASVTFRHSQHTNVECSACHSTAQRHGATTVKGVQDCRSCHHTTRAAADCVSCHRVEELRQVSSTVQRVFNITLGSLNRPTRTVPFEHAAHLTADCRTCHTGGKAMTPTAANCNSCHEQHHRPTANCNSCHQQAPKEAHTREAHLGCGGVGCHDAAPAAIREAPRTRSLCLSCHVDQAVDHKPGTCSDCHRMPRQKAAR
jgi:Ni/Fe-hydrogenase subunit HybB-like protein/Fe-S-cluster-containing dehydrogenase component